MAEPFLGEIRIFAGNFAPAGWAFCNGQLLAIVQYEALFTLIGTTYGGDGVTTFALPDLRGRLPLHEADGHGLFPYRLGQRGGVESVLLTTAQIPAHTHAAQASSQGGSQTGPGGGVWAASALNQFTTATPSASMNAAAIQNSGSNQSHDNRMPYLPLSFIIALNGIYPTP